MDLNTEKSKPKVATVNNNMRGELVGQKPMEDTNSIAIGGRIQAGKLAQESRNVNDNVSTHKRRRVTVFNNLSA